MCKILNLNNNIPKVNHVTSAIDCGIVVNPNHAKNMVEGCVVDGIGVALYGNLSFKDGNTNHKNFGSSPYLVGLR